MSPYAVDAPRLPSLGGMGANGMSDYESPATDTIDKESEGQYVK